ncbi:outer membrane beta-barrel protein [Nibrella saemangeumensis]|uniref:outer membrane beta-barrel protein n=1 Tax=Nibrella saemangeumensis TaxID=1084526 RepID=UPI0031EB9EC8
MLRKLSPLLLLIAAAQLTTAQSPTEKGRWTVGVDVGSFTFQLTENVSSFSGSVNPSTGYFIVDNFLVGVGLPLSYSTQRQGNPTILLRGSSNSLGISPYVRYYVGQSNVKPYLGVSYSIATSYGRYTNLINSPQRTVNRGNSMQFTPSAGVAYFLTRNVSLDTQVGYHWVRSRMTSKADGLSENKFTTIYRNASLTIGFNLFFGR